MSATRTARDGFFRKAFHAGKRIPVGYALRAVVLVAALGAHSAPSILWVRHVQDLISTCGLFTLVVIQTMLGILIWVSYSFNPRASFARPLSWMMDCLIAWELSQSLIGRFGDAGYRWFLQNPNSVAAVIAAGLVMLAIFILGALPILFAGVADQIGSTSTSMASLPMRACSKAPATVSDLWHVSAHEAGHVLIYAALGFIPEGVKCVVNERFNDDRVLGYVSDIGMDDLLSREVFAEWSMLVLLAGRRGEIHLRGSPTLGSSHDHLRWLNQARSYLANHSRGIYYIEPQSVFEQTANESKLATLQREQIALLDEFFDMNDTVFRELVEGLFQARSLDAADLRSYLRRVTFPDGFAFPLGSFASFSTESACRSPASQNYQA